MTNDRTKLPYRKNCEGYFLFRDDSIVAQDTGKGYVEFPGGGIDEGESPKNAILREASEETGAMVKNLKFVEKINFDWDENWAKTEKQKGRYKQYRGEEMHLFIGKVSKFVNADGDLKNNDPALKGRKFMEIKEVIEKIQELKPFPQNMTGYYAKQLYYLRNISRLLMCEA